MPITEALGALGAWNLSLREDTPRELRDRLQYFGHITVHTGRVQPELIGDGLLRSSRYTGVLRGKGESDAGFDLTGCGMEFWLGDEDDKGVVIENLMTFTAQTYTQTVRDLLALTTAVTEGTFNAVAGTYTGSHQFQVLRKAIAYVASTGGIEYRVNGDATMDLGTEAQLYVTDPKCLIVKRGAGMDMDLRALLGTSDVDSDVEDFTTRVVLLAASTEAQVATGDADINPVLNVYKDLFGNPIKLTRMVSESTTDGGNATARAQLQLNRFTSTRDSLMLSTTEYDISGSARVGDYIYAFNPDISLVDLNNEVMFRGGKLNPVKLRLIESTWPVAPGFMVAYRRLDGQWLDLTDYVKFEAGQTTVKVGGYNRTLTGSGTEPIGRLPQPDSSVPGAPTWNQPFRLGVYQSEGTGTARGEAILDWNEPTNTDLTPIVDGSHYEIRYRHATVPAYPVTWDMVTNAAYTWDSLTAAGGTWDNPIQFPESEWQTAIQNFDTTTFRLQDLIPSHPYEVQIRAVDLATPSNVGAWSTLALFQTTDDDIPPSPPAAPFIASNPLSVQMAHTLGRADGGSFNLERDLHHLELHGGPEPLFRPNDSTLIGKALANYGSIVGQIPVVQTFSIANLNPVYYKVIAVDEAGNKSLPSDASVATVGLIDDQYISNLTVSKLTSGTMTADTIVGGRIATMQNFGFPGVELTNQGIEGWTSVGFRALHWDSSTGKLHVNGRGGIEIQDGALTIKNAAGTVIAELGECSDGRHGIQIYKDNGTRVLRAGEVASGTEGMEIIDDVTGNLVRVNTLAFGMATATLAGAVATSLSTYNGSTPSVTVTIGNSGTALVHIGAWLITAASSGATVGFGVSGATTIAPTDVNAVGFNVASSTMGAGRSFTVTGLNPGSNTFYLAYKSTFAGNTTNYLNRTIAVQPY